MFVELPVFLAFTLPLSDESYSLTISIEPTSHQCIFFLFLID
jgi:hypothetical protein